MLLDALAALDVFRLLRAVATEDLMRRWECFRVDLRSHRVAYQAQVTLKQLFSVPEASGRQMAVRATQGLEDPDEIASACAALASDLGAALATSAIGS